MSVMLGSVDLNFIYLSPLQDYGKESQAKDVIEEYFKSKKWSVNKTMKWSSGVCYWFELLGWILSIILLCTNLVAWLVHHFMSSFSKLKISDLFIYLFLILKKLFALWITLLLLSQKTLMVKQHGSQICEYERVKLELCNAQFWNSHHWSI